MTVQQQIFAHSLLGLKQLCLAMAKSIDTILDMMEQQIPDPPADGAAPDGEKKCPHPLAQRIPIPAMGKKRFKCMACDEDVTMEDQ